MMNAVISGRAGLALLIEGESLMSLDVDDLETLVPRSSYDLRFLLADATDLVTLDDTDHEQTAQRLDLEHDMACALDMTLIALDPETSMELRAEAVAALDELLGDSRVIDRLELTMYAKPLPDSADLMGALFCTEAKTVAARAFFERLSRDQAAIGAVREAWDALPDSLFGDEATAKAVFHDAVFHEGLFRRLALSYGDQAGVSSFLLGALTNESIHGLRNYRDVVQQWSGPVRNASRADAPEIENEYDDYAAQTETRQHSTGRDRRLRREPPFVILRKVQSQKDMIVAAMRERDLTRAREVIEELIDYQRKTGRPEHRAKTLCDLAMEAKALGIVALQLELTGRAVEAKPDDAWSWAQHGDALLNMGRLDEAARAYEQADAFGVDPIARKGRAEVLKAQGRFQEAEAAFDQVIAAFPQDVFAKTGRAEVLKAQGRLREAEAPFDEAIAAHPENVVAKNGRAETLKAQGRLEDAEAAFDEVIAAHPENIVAKNGRAEVLKAQGRFEDAEAAFDEVIAAYPENVFAKNGRAEVLKAQGRFEDAEAAFDEVIAAHPENVVAKTGRAEVLKAQGRLEDAEAAFDEVIAAHPQDVFAKTGRAEVLKARGRLEDAEAAFDEAIAAHPENVVAKNGRAEVLKAQGRLAEAETAFDEVIAAHPEHVVAKTGRAEVLKSQGRLWEALASYEVIAASYPNNPVSRNARSCILAALGRYAEALRDLPSANPGTEADWIGYHIRGMTLLRMGDVEAASQVFESGKEFCPWGSQKAFFITALALTRIRNREFGAASEMLDQVTVPAFKPHAQLLRIHALGELNEFDRASTVYTDLKANPRPFSDELPDEFYSRYIAREGNRHDDAWVYTREVDIFLLTARV
ncbi:MAG: tetratricopeptide repeat protein [Acidobacteriota bacterium]